MDLWLLDDGRVLRLDERGTVLATIALDPPLMERDSAQLIVGAGAVWVAAGHVFLYRIDTARNKVTAALDIGYHLDGLAVSDKFVFVSNDRWEGRLIRVDPRDNRIDVAIPFHAHALAFGAGSLWATWINTITRVDAASFSTQANVDLGGYVSQHAFGLDALWAVTLDDHTAGTDDEQSRVWRIDIENNRHEEVAQLRGRPNLAVGAGAVWLDESCLCRLDPESRQLTRFPDVRLLPCFTRGDALWGLDGDGAVLRFHQSRTEIVGTQRGRWLSG
jgi:hypothetical protein